MANEARPIHRFDAEERDYRLDVAAAVRAVTAAASGGGGWTGLLHSLLAERLLALQSAYSQIPRIQSATGIPFDALKGVVDQNVEGTFWIFGSPYVNVLKLNLVLIKVYPSIYKNFG